MRKMNLLFRIFFFKYFYFDLAVLKLSDNSHKFESGYDCFKVSFWYPMLDYESDLN